MTTRRSRLPSASAVLRDYADLPEFDGLPMTSVSQVGNFGNQPIHVAAVRGIMAEVVALLDGGADVNARGEHDCTPLHHAVGQQHVDVVKLLLRRGAVATTRDGMGRLPEDIAESYLRADLVGILRGDPDGY